MFFAWLHAVCSCECALFAGKGVYVCGGACADKQATHPQAAVLGASESKPSVIAHYVAGNTH